MKPPVLVDIETDGQSPFDGQLLLVGWCRPGEPVAVIEWPCDTAVDIAVRTTEASELRQLLADPEVPVISMTKYDARYLKLQGWEVTGPYYDIQVMAWVLNENQPLNLDALALRYCRVKMDKRLSRSSGEVFFAADDGVRRRLVDWRVWPDEVWRQFVEYCWRDVSTEAELFQTLWERLDDTTWLDFFRDECVPFTEVLLDMECAGLPVNLEDSEVLREELEERVGALGPRLLAEGGLPSTFNLNSNDQLAAYLYFPVAELVDSLDMGELQTACIKSCLDGEHEDCEPEEGGLGHAVGWLPVGFALDKLGRTQVHGRWTFKGRSLPATEKTDGGKLSVSSPVLKSNMKAVMDPWVQELFGYRQMTKALTTYLRKYPLIAHEGRLYGRFNQTGTKTGRLSSSEPNLQNQPSHGELGERMRGLFQGNLVVGDYSQLEPRLMAHFSEDPRLLAVYREDRDSYLDLAEAVFGRKVDKDSDERGIAKTLLLAMGYGAGHKKVAQILTINGFPTDEATADAYLKELQRYYSRFFAWREAVISRVKHRGYVETLSGRHRRLKSAFADRRNWKNIGYGERQAVNAVVQGSAGDIVARTMVRTQNGLLTLLAQVHDELVWEYAPQDFGMAQPDSMFLASLRAAAETTHGFALSVPLKFEPHVGSSWFAAKEGLELPDDLDDSTEGFEEDA